MTKVAIVEIMDKYAVLVNKNGRKYWAVRNVDYPAVATDILKLIEAEKKK